MSQNENDMSKDVKTEVEKPEAVTGTEVRVNETNISSGLEKEIEDKQKIIEEINKAVVARLVAPHPKPGKIVTNDDLDRLGKEAQIMYDLCFAQVGPYRGGLAVAHTQIDAVNPLAFFVTAQKDIVINPVIVNKTKHPVDSIEGCLTFPHLPPKLVKRAHKVTIQYQTIKLEKEGSDKIVLSPVMTRNLSGRDAFVAQHETDHLNGIYIYEYEPAR